MWSIVKKNKIKPQTATGDQASKNFPRPISHENKLVDLRAVLVDDALVAADRGF